MNGTRYTVNGSRWYVIHTKPLSEDKVCKQIARSPDCRIARLHEMEVFCPKIRSASYGRDGSDLVRYKPLFPSYIFLNWDLSDPSKHRLVKYTRGVNKVLGDGTRPVPISDSVIDTIKSRTNEAGFIEQQMFKVGDHVRVRRGHLRDLIGILERPVSDSGRVAVLLRIFSREVRAHLRCADIVES